MVAYRRTDPGGVFTKVITNDGAPGSEATAGDNNAEQSAGGSHQLVADLVVDGKKAILFYSEETAQDLWRDENDDEGGWGTDVEEKDAVTADWIRGSVFNRADGTTVYGYVWDNGSAGGTGWIYYDELVLREVTPVLIPKTIDDVRIRM